MRVGLVGCGVIGRRRAELLRGSDSHTLVIVADVDRSRANALATEIGCRASEKWQDVVAADLDAVIVSTTNDWLAPVSLAAIQAGRHVLVEKPMARTSAEASEVVDAAARRGVVLKVGFNHRHHHALRRAHELAGQGAVGNLLFARCRYGHGGRQGYEREWRTDHRLSGGGELLDQGIHVIDLLRWFFGEFTEAVGFTAAYVWRGAEPVEDNAFAMLRTGGGQVAAAHASWTQWKNLFSLEIFGDRGYLIAEGLGGSYGPERLVIGRRHIEGGVPDEETVTFQSGDESWAEEWRVFSDAVREGNSPPANGYDGVQALRLVEAIYESARTGRVVRL